jgi:acetate kinase
MRFARAKSLCISIFFTAFDGFMMLADCGSIEPGIILYLLQEKIDCRKN